MGIFSAKWKHPDPYERKAAVENIVDQGILAEMAKTDSHDFVRRAAVLRITNQAVLGEIVKNDKQQNVRSTAISRITDVSVLMELAQNSPERDDRAAAVRTLEGHVDQSLLATIARSEPKLLSRVGVARLEDQDLLGTIAQNMNSGQEVRQSAVWRLQSQPLLEAIAKNENDSDSVVRGSAVNRVQDQIVLAAIAKSDSNWHVRLDAVDRLEDQATLADIAKHDSRSEVRSTAVGRVEDQTLLADLEKHDTHSDVRNSAGWRLGYLKEHGAHDADIRHLRKLIDSLLSVENVFGHVWWKPSGGRIVRLLSHAITGPSDADRSGISGQTEFDVWGQKKKGVLTVWWNKGIGKVPEIARLSESKLVNSEDVFK